MWLKEYRNSKNDRKIQVHSRILITYLLSDDFVNKFDCLRNPNHAQSYASTIPVIQPSLKDTIKIVTLFSISQKK